MKTTQSTQPLTDALIHNLLQGNTPLCESADYVRLMEIYCVVKAGGVAEQVKVARRLKETERATLQEEIQNLDREESRGNRVQALEQEIQELEKSVASRLQYLSTISAEEEAIVRECLPKIDAYFKTLGHTGNKPEPNFEVEG